MGVLAFLQEDYKKVRGSTSDIRIMYSCYHRRRRNLPLRLTTVITSLPEIRSKLSIQFVVTRGSVDICHCRRVLTWLVPLRLLLKGSRPSSVLLERYPAIDGLYGPFIRATMQGDIVAFDDALQALESRLVQLNVWIIILRMREIALRGVFKKVYVYSSPSAAFLFHY
jgi:hypothetical protein